MLTVVLLCFFVLLLARRFEETNRRTDTTSIKHFTTINCFFGCAAVVVMTVCSPRCISFLLVFLIAPIFFCARAASVPGVLFTSVFSGHRTSHTCTRENIIILSNIDKNHFYNYEIFAKCRWEEWRGILHMHANCVLPTPNTFLTAKQKICT